MTSYITLWRDPDNVLQWDHYVSHSDRERDQLVDNIKKRNVIQYATYPLGDIVASHSSSF